MPMLSSRFVVYGVLAIFLCILTFTTLFAYTRGFSGTTGLDMAKVQKMRTDVARQIAEGRQ